MKRILLLLAFLCCIFTACQHSDKKKNNLLSKDKLISQFFAVNTNKDTTLVTANGALITIPQGALAGSETVQLEIKEAYSIQQIIMAGLTTQSNGKPLSSGGMIYINAVGGKSIKVIKPIAIKIPTPSIDKRMQLFKGDTDANGNINWVNPDSLPANTQSAAFENGRTLFMNNCASCHDVNKDGTGPALSYILERTASKKLLYRYTRDNVKVMAEGSVYYRCLYERRNKTAMNLFTSLTDNDLDNLYGYIENESRVRNLPMVKDEISPCIDSCSKYRKLKNKLEEKKYKLTQEKVAMIVEQFDNPPSADSVFSIDTTNATVVFTSPYANKKVVPVYNQSLYYQFTINTFGWYNVDELLNEGFGYTESSLTVKVNGEYKQNINLYLIIPSAKVFAPGGFLDGKTDEYAFYTTDGRIRLPQNINAFVIAVGEAGDNVVFAKKDFYTTTSQHFDMTLSVISKDAFNAEIKNLHFTDFKFSVRDTKYAKPLRKIIKSLEDVEKIKPKNCDCNCGIQLDAPVQEYYYDTTVKSAVRLFK